MINLKQEIQNYSAINLKSLEESDTDIPDSIRNSVILYNKALESIRIDSEDMAIIELKKAIAMNPGFHEAMNLLGLCYCYIKEYAKAAEMFEKVVAAENNSINALRYLSLMNSEDHVAASLESKTRTLKREEGKPAGSQKSTSFLSDFLNIKKNWRVDYKKYLAGIAFGVIVMVIVGIFVYSPSNEASGKTSDKAVAASSDQAGTRAPSEDAKAVKQDLEKAQSDLKVSNAQIDYYKSVLKLQDVVQLASQKKYGEAADLLIVLKTVSFQTADKARYDQVYKDVMPKAVSQVMNDALRFSSQKKYQEALDQFGKLLLYADDSVNVEYPLYVMGKCYLSVNDTQNAIQTYQKLVAKYPQGRYSQYAQNRLSQLQGTP